MPFKPKRVLSSQLSVANSRKLAPNHIAHAEREEDNFPAAYMPMSSADAEQEEVRLRSQAPSTSSMAVAFSSSPKLEASPPRDEERMSISASPPEEDDENYFYHNSELLERAVQKDVDLHVREYLLRSDLLIELRPYVVWQAVRLARENKSFEEICTALEPFASKSSIRTYVETALAVANVEDGFSLLSMEWRGASQRWDWYSDNLDAKIKFRALLIEDFKRRIAARPRECPAKGKDFLSLINENLIPWVLENWPLVDEEPRIKPVSNEKTAFAMIHELGYRYGRPKKEPYFVGHERENNVAARRKFCSEMLELLCSTVYAGPIDAKTEDITWHRPAAEEYMLFAHDEFCMGAKEGPVQNWSFAQDFFFKDKGRTVMVSDFITSNPDRPFLTMTDFEKDQFLQKYGEESLDNTRLMLEPKIGNYVDSDRFVAYVENVMKMNLVAFPGIKHVYMFDQATTHTAIAIALFALPKGYNTKPPKNTPKVAKWLNAAGEETVYELFDDNGSIFKGIERISVELNLLSTREAKATKKADIAELLSAHPGFLQHSKLENMAKKLSASIIVKFVPKFHCELNPIERIWAFIKNYVRELTDYTYESMRKLIAEAREKIPNDTVAKYWRKSFRIMFQYDKFPEKDLADIVKDVASIRLSRTNKSKRRISREY